jgi:hypothetical protein
VFRDKDAIMSTFNLYNNQIQRSLTPDTSNKQILPNYFLTNSPNSSDTMQVLSSSTICFFILYTASSMAFVISPAVRSQKDHFYMRLRSNSGALSETLKMKSDPISESDKSDLKEDGIEKKNVQSKSLLRLAELSLEDYEWRQSIFKTDEAARKVEESLARMMGDEASYVRPMDASTEKIGPLVSP